MGAIGLLEILKFLGIQKVVGGIVYWKKGGWDLYALTTVSPGSVGWGAALGLTKPVCKSQEA